MLIVLSPAKTLDYESPVTAKESSQPLFLDPAQQLVEIHDVGRFGVPVVRPAPRTTSSDENDLELLIDAVVEANERRVAELEARLAEPETYADQALLLSLTQDYRKEQDAQEALYDALEQAEAALREAEDGD